MKALKVCYWEQIITPRQAIGACSRYHRLKKWLRGQNIISQTLSHLHWFGILYSSPIVLPILLEVVISSGTQLHTLIAKRNTDSITVSWLRIWYFPFLFDKGNSNTMQPHMARLHLQFTYRRGHSHPSLSPGFWLEIRY